MNADWQCHRCGHRPERIDGFVAFDPALARRSDGFKPEYFRRLADVEAGNFWFVARNKLIGWAVRHYFPTEKRKFCEIGCGTGYALAGIAEAMPNWQLSATEIYADGLSFAADRVRAASLYQLDARRMPFREEFDVIGAFDVLEHIEQDEQVLTEIHRALTDRGGLVITVPQHRFLWSQQDEHACHVRRYTAREIRQKLEHANFEVQFSSSFVSLLLPLMYLTRRRARLPDAEYDMTADLRLPRVLNALLAFVMSVERALIKAGIRFPFGGSLLIVARKNGGAV
ncbi:MAG TPA: class I SAM-dependent methyltransferase [Trinickia sp.]|uniref:class I SAM-dependent methyltransferase n=1 Tax=Trinickia sp. TaxID=2571163 RepID=UPI002C0B0432|nr:class I SAM-dependent methyltransferase [Trinickia sp.]HVW52318.1 class I SAM-dependent methyltransferase [Trinickia sp.]